MVDKQRRVVWKFAIDVRSEPTTVTVSRNAQVRFVALDPATRLPSIWVETDPDASPIDRRFVVYATGQPIEGDGGYPYDLHVGSVIEGAFVWHIYERRA